MSALLDDGVPVAPKLSPYTLHIDPLAEAPRPLNLILRSSACKLLLIGTGTGALNFSPRRGNLWARASSASRLGEEPPKLSAGGIKRSLLIFAAVVQERSAEFDHLEKDL